jgi:uncharacterized protein
MIKLKKLESILEELGSFVIAFSGGVDSSFLLYTSNHNKKLRVLALTIRTPYMPSREINEAVEFTAEYKIPHQVMDLYFPELVRNNPDDRCYLCKSVLFGRVSLFASENNYKYVADGTNFDDMSDYRPGLKALSEMKVRSPLAEAGLTKEEIRKLCREAGLKVWDKPAMACLMTRLPYNTEVRDDMLRMVEKAEEILFDRGYPGTRVRYHGDTARIECLPGFLEKLVNDPEKNNIVDELKELGFRYISLDLEGYRTGSMKK